MSATKEGWKKLDAFYEIETENIRSAISPNVREIFAYCLAQR